MGTRRFPESSVRGGGHGDAVAPVSRVAGRDVGPNVVFQSAGKVQCLQGEGPPVVSSLWGRDSTPHWEVVLVLGPLRGGNYRLVGQGWHGVMPSILLQGTSRLGFS